MPTKAKICGLSTPETLDAAIANGAAYVGFVFFPPSPRHLDPERASALAARAPGHVRKVGVFVDPDDGLIDAAIAAGIDTIQLHGKESPARAAAIRARTGLELWKAVPVRTAADLAPTTGFRGAADHILYDAKTPDTALLPGGMGLRFDWKLLHGFVHPLPWALSGGLDAANVGDAIRTTGATLVDTSSGVESAPGIKDVDKIAAFLKAVAAS
ncbi:phosphoribosylanthranilate isomerase [Sphingomonas colocasiae]|uniref:N-(5'-phosphoribosyl)anthranilate isomerase n=1 Tax=Sphingomonas colocasiae TaxID=1848973 RepID=A0ABS7PIQ4_9SPHN|nr:phosphoribosylanthranilate isomerase [Sphingomonas colocasiae]MBY8821180.1 phosphoribosylanthranilate isomerase [Sphingomonas colocasiae]